MLKRCPPKKDEINDAARKLHYRGQNTLTISWEKPEKYLSEYEMHFSRKTNRKSEEDKLVHSFNENLRKRKVQWNVSFRRSNFASPPEVFFLHNYLALRKWKTYPMSFAAQMRNGNNLMQSADLITYSIDEITKSVEILQYYNISCPTTNVNDTLVRLHSKSHQKSFTILRV